MAKDTAVTKEVLEQDRSKLKEIINRIMPAEDRVMAVAQLAKGVYKEDNGKRIYQTDPDLAAITWLEERATGKVPSAPEERDAIPPVTIAAQIIIPNQIGASQPFYAKGSPIVVPKEVIRRSRKSPAHEDAPQP